MIKSKCYHYDEWGYLLDKTRYSSIEIITVPVPIGIDEYIRELHENGNPATVCHDSVFGEDGNIFTQTRCRGYDEYGYPAGVYAEIDYKHFSELIPIPIDYYIAEYHENGVPAAVCVDEGPDSERGTASSTTCSHYSEIAEFLY